ncbi:MAG: hypothetical protein J6B56_02600 [Clostridia bacterium]|nr:hypothetical protein [Clostridia bacterium]
MEERNVAGFKIACKEELKNWGIMTLRAYGRNIGMRKPTKLKKAELIEQIIGVLCGELVQVQTNRGAPVKNYYIDEKAVGKIELIKRKYLQAEEPPIVAPVVVPIAVEESKIPPKKKPATATVVLKDEDGKKVVSFSFEIKL